MIAKNNKMKRSTLVAILIIAALSIGCTFTSASLNSADVPNNEVITDINTFAVKWADAYSERDAETINPNALLFNKERMTLITEADVNHDGIKEAVYLDKSQMDVTFDVILRILDSDGNEIWSEPANTAHPGWNQLLLYEQEGKYYLLRYNPTMYQGIGTYEYCLFTLDGGTEHVVRSNMLEFDLNDRNNPDISKMVSFANEVNELLGKSILLLSSDGGNFHFGPSSAEPFFESYSWLDGFPDLYGPGDSLENKLNKFRNFILSNP